MTLQVLRTSTFFIWVQEGNLKLSFFNRTYWFALQGLEENMHFICCDSWPSELHLSAILAQWHLAEEDQRLVVVFLQIRDNARLWISAFPSALQWHFKMWQLWISSAIYWLDCTWLTDREGAIDFFFFPSLSVCYPPGKLLQPNIIAVTGLCKTLLIYLPC